MMQDFFDTKSIKNEYDVVIVGAGAAGCTAAMYTSRDELSTLVIEKTMPGGQMGLTAYIDNHPGIPETITGADIADKYYQQAVRFGATLRYGICVDIKMREDQSKEIYIEGRSEPIIAKTVIIATGCTPKKMDVPGENKYWGHGISTCATCDGGFYKNKVVVTVGGGNTALNESVYLTRFAKKVYLVHRRDGFRGTKVCQRAVYDHPDIELVLNSVVTEIHGDDIVKSVTIKNVKTGETREIEASGVFTFIGQTPSAAPFDKYLEVDEGGFLITNESMETKLNGVYVAGDIRSKQYRQIAIAVGEGVIAAQKAAQYLQDIGLNACLIRDEESKG